MSYELFGLFVTEWIFIDRKSAQTRLKKNGPYTVRNALNDL